MGKTKKVAIFGGSFNPPTKSHEAIARACMDQADLDEIWLMPSAERLDKSYSVDDAHRVSMLGLIRHRLNDSRLFVSRYELDLPRPTTTIRTVGELAVSHSNIQPIFVYGADSYYNMPKWENGDFLQSNLQMLIVPRAGYSEPSAPNVKMLDIPTELQVFNSTEVRNRVMAGETISHLVDPWVEEYITDNRLYVARQVPEPTLRK